jgi:hypothetical protein
MYFKIYRDVHSSRLRKLRIDLYDENGHLLDTTFMFAYFMAGLLSLRLRLKMRMKRMLRLQKIMAEAVKEV